MRTITALLIPALCLLSGGVATQKSADGVAAQAVKNDEEPTRKIPLESIFSTAAQKPLKPARRSSDSAAKDLNQIFREFRSGLTNVFLAQADDFNAAVGSTRAAFTGARSGDRPIGPLHESKASDHWFVAYLGTAHSTPPAWQLDYFEQKERRLTLAFWKPNPTGATRDSHQYFVWVPLGKLPPGEYSLELFDVNRRQTVLMRRVLIDEN
jgi:hypothetical protein